MFRDSENRALHLPASGSHPRPQGWKEGETFMSLSLMVIIFSTEEDCYHQLVIMTMTVTTNHHEVLGPMLRMSFYHFRQMILWGDFPYSHFPDEVQCSYGHEVGLKWARAEGSSLWLQNFCCDTPQHYLPCAASFTLKVWLLWVESGV